MEIRVRFGVTRSLPTPRRTTPAKSKVRRFIQESCTFLKRTRRSGAGFEWTARTEAGRCSRESRRVITGALTIYKFRG